MFMMATNMNKSRFDYEKPPFYNNKIKFNSTANISLVFPQSKWQIYLNMQEMFEFGFNDKHGFSVHQWWKCGVWK